LPLPSPNEGKYRKIHNQNLLSNKNGEDLKSPKPVTRNDSPGIESEKDKRINDFPLITNDGVKDLLGNDEFANAVNIFGEKQVESIKRELGEGVHGPLLFGRCLIDPKPDKHKSKGKDRDRRDPSMRHQIEIEFNDDKVTHYDCTCPTFRKIAEISFESPEGSPIYKRPCRHIGAVLLVLKKNKKKKFFKENPLLIHLGNICILPQVNVILRKNWPKKRN